MAVFDVTVTYRPTGTSTSRPVVAEDGEQARQMAEAEWDIEPDDPDAEWSVTQRPDPDGHTERVLMDMERRRLEAEMWRF
jgi:hypothetical protein